MNYPPILVKNIQQSDNYSFTIEWSDGKKYLYRFSQLQNKCPCAKCFDTNTQARKIDALSVDDHVRAIRIKNVGRYALRIDFTSGCSTGIYNFALLRELHE